MKTIAIKMKNYATDVNIVNNNDIERRLLNFLLISFGALAFLYILFLGNMVFNIVERRTLEAEARSLTNEVGGLELNYLSMSSNVDLELSRAMGFEEIKINFATRNSKSLGLGSSAPGLENVKSGKNEI